MKHCTTNYCQSDNTVKELTEQQLKKREELLAKGKIQRTKYEERAKKIGEEAQALVESVTSRLSYYQDAIKHLDGLPIRTAELESDRLVIEKYDNIRLNDHFRVEGIARLILRLQKSEVIIREYELNVFNSLMENEFGYLFKTTDEFVHNAEQFVETIIYA